MYVIMSICIFWNYCCSSLYGSTRMAAASALQGPGRTSREVIGPEIAHFGPEIALGWSRFIPDRAREHSRFANSECANTSILCCAHIWAVLVLAYQYRHKSRIVCLAILNP